MAERQRSKDGSRDTERVLDESRGPTDQAGRTGGNLARTIGSEDEMKRSGDGDAGVTRARKADEEKPGTSNLGEENR